MSDINRKKCVDRPSYDRQFWGTDDTRDEPVDMDGTRTDPKFGGAVVYRSPKSRRAGTERSVSIDEDPIRMHQSWNSGYFNPYVSR
jgi:hypothetical protein